MNTYMLTFGCRYSQETNPQFAGAHPDGWVEIVAHDYDAANAIAYAVFGQRWAFLYTESQFDPSFHSMGCLLRLEQTKALVP